MLLLGSEGTGGNIYLYVCMEGGWYAVVDDILAAGIVVDVDRDAAQGGDFGGELRESGVVLSR